LHLYRRGRVRGNERHLREWTMHQHGGWGNLRMSNRISVEWKTELIEVHWCERRSMLW